VTRAGHIATRTCVGCGKRDAQAHLVRLRKSADGAVVACAHKADGRSAYVHASLECVRGLARSKGLAKSLRTTTTRPQRLELMEVLEDQLASHAFATHAVHASDAPRGPAL
jgi:predicted RNA-binding protein YlxR (DUF448 family)